MTTTIGATIRLLGDSTGATAALRATGDAARTAGAALSGVAQTAIGAAAGMVSVGAAMRVAQMASRQAAEAFRAYLDSNEEARAATDGFSASIQQSRAAMAEAVLGGGVLQQALAALASAGQQLSAGASSNSTQLQELARQGMGAAADAAAVVLRVLAELYAVMEGGVLVVRAVVVGVAILGDQLAALAAAAVETGRLIIGGFLSVWARILDAAVDASDALGVRLPDSVRAAADALRSMSRGVADGADPMRELRIGAEASGARIARLGEAAEGMAGRIDLARGAAVAIGETLRDLGDDVRSGEVDTSILADAQRTGAAAARQQAEAIEEIIKALTEYDALAASLQAKEAAASLQRKAEADALREAELRAMAEMQAAREAAAQREAELARRVAEERLAIRQREAQAVVGIAAGELADLAAGNQNALQAVRGFVGSVLQMKGGAYAAEAAALAFVPGLQGQAAGLAAAAAAMITAGAALSGRGGGRGAGVVGAGQAPAPTAGTLAPQQSITVNTTIGVAGDPRGAARMVAGMVRDAVREGA